GHAVRAGGSPLGSEYSPGAARPRTTAPAGTRGATVTGRMGMAGQRLGPYRLERLLGQGGMGQVWLAHADPVGGRPGRTVALKLLPAELAADPTYRSRSEREAELAARLHDRHLVSIHAHGELDGRLFIEMEYVEGEDLSRILPRGPLPPERAVDIVAQTAAALDAAHRAGLVHRDVKPSNIVIRRDGLVYL